ncbi:MAG: hypothetical protein MUF43_12990, partial [Flavobacterium sp.]|nr:hypothetical protein [Flavobacterium sp.]
FQVLQLTFPNPNTNNVETITLARDQTNDPANKCEVCATARPKICKVMDALNSKAGGGLYKSIIENKLCANRALTDENLLAIVGTLLSSEFSATELQDFLKNLNGSTCTSADLCGNIGQLNGDIVLTWHYLYNKLNARTNWNTLQQFGKLNERAKALVVLFSDGDTKRLINFCADLPKLHNDKLFLDFVNEAKNDKYVRGFVKKSLSEEDQQDLEGILADWTKQNDENPEVQKWLLYGENSTRFQQNRTLGNDLSANISEVFQKKTEPYYSTWASQIGLTKATLDQYLPLLEIPLNTSGGFMKADILLVKRNAINPNIIDDAIVIENKLSQNTDLTDRQKEGFGAILRGTTIMNVSYNIPLYNLTQNQDIPVSSDKIYKFYDHGTKDISKVSIIKITTTN